MSNPSIKLGQKVKGMKKAKSAKAAKQFIIIIQGIRTNQKSAINKFQLFFILNLPLLRQISIKILFLTHLTIVDWASLTFEETDCKSSLFAFSILLFVSKGRSKIVLMLLLEK